MAEIRCFVPIRLQLTGTFDDSAAADLESSLAATIAARLSAARRAVREECGETAEALVHEPEFRFSGRLDEEQEQRVRSSVTASIASAADDRGLGSGSPFQLVSYTGTGVASSLAPRRRAAARQSKRPWIIRRSLNFHALAGDFLSLIAELTPSEAGAIDLYSDQFYEPRWVELWVVEVRRRYELDEISSILGQRASELGRVRPDQTIAHAEAPTEAFRRRLIEIDLDNVVASGTHDLTSNASRFAIDASGRVQLEPGCRVLFAWMVLPRVVLADNATVGTAERHPIALSMVETWFDSEEFRRRYGVELADLLSELPDAAATLVVIPLVTRRRVAAVTLQRLLGGYTDSYEQSPGQRGGDLLLLNQATLDSLPDTVRPVISPHSDLPTQVLPAEAGRLWWEADWRGAVAYAVFAPTEDQIRRTRYGPLARQTADFVIAYLAQDQDDSSWHRQLDYYIEGSFRNVPPFAFELFLEELEVRGVFDSFFDAVAATGGTPLLRHVVDRARGTRFAAHPRVEALYQWMNAQRRASMNHTYRIAEQEIWLDHDPDHRVRVGDNIADVDSIYSLERTEKVLKEERRAELQAAIEQESRTLVEQIIDGRDTEIYDASEFLEKVFTKAAEAIHLTEDDFLDVEIERTFRLVSLDQRVEDSLEVVYVTYDVVERVDGGPWTVVKDSRTRLRDALPGAANGFELTLWFWGYNKSAVVVQAFAIGVSVIAILAIGWELGVVALLVKAGGGAGMVLAGVGISTLIYLLQVIFTDKTFSFEKLLMAALDGYLFAVGFSGAGIIGRGLAAGIGKATLRRLLFGWFVERLAVGTIGGASSMFLIMFTEDTINILLERQQGYRGIEQYIQGMAVGALFGVVFEFGIGLLQPILRAGGASGLQTLGNLMTNVRAAGISAERWGVLMTEALGNMRTRLEVFLGDALATKITTAMRQRVLESLHWYAGEARLALFRRVLELTPEALSRSSVEGLERLLVLSPRHLADQAVLDVLNGVTGARLRTFLETFSAIEAPIAEQVMRGNALPAVAAAPELLLFVQRDVVMSRLIGDLAHLPQGAAAARLERILEVARTRPEIPSRLTQGAEFARGKTNTIYDLVEDPGLLFKPGGGRMARESAALVELELLGIETVYGSAVMVEGQTVLIMERFAGKGSKDIIGTVSEPLRPYQHVELVTQRTIDDLHRIRGILEANNVRVRDFQFIVREADGAIFMNDPTGLTLGGARALTGGRMHNVIEQFESIWRKSQQRAAGGTPPAEGGQP